ncbi:MAG: SagB/ThcOx family dehydrogenase [Anaerolineales bacterium]|nr:SagB/ThcOx family dehydrogenase [Anaerolineales bacterium]
MNEKGIGDQYQQAMKYSRGKLSGGSLDWANKPGITKHYPDALCINLTEPKKTDGAPLWQVLKDRRSVRRFLDIPLAEQDVSQLLWAAQGITKRHPETPLRTAPSAGALYPVETYLAVHRVESIDPGIYHYNPLSHALEQLKPGDFRRQTAAAALDQHMAATANIVFIWTGVFPRSKWKYKQRAYRYVYLDAGHIAQNVALAAVALGLGSCQIAALYDDEANALIGVDGVEESVIYMTVIGRLRE